MPIDANAVVTVGDKIRFLRLSKAWSQEELADQAGVDVKTARNAEAGKNSPQFRTIQKFARVFSVDPAQLLSRHCILRSMDDNIEYEKIAQLATQNGELVFSGSEKSQSLQCVVTEFCRRSTEFDETAKLRNAQMTRKKGSYTCSQNLMVAFLVFLWDSTGSPIAIGSVEARSQPAPYDGLHIDSR